jgi:hypothetical protein
MPSLSAILTRSASWRAGQEFLRGGEGLGLLPRRPDQPLETLPDRGVVVHNRDNSFRFRRLPHLMLPDGTSEV